MERMDIVWKCAPREVTICTGSAEKITSRAAIVASLGRRWLGARMVLTHRRAPLRGLQLQERPMLEALLAHSSSGLGLCQEGSISRSPVE